MQAGVTAQVPTFGCKSNRRRDNRRSGYISEVCTFIFTDSPESTAASQDATNTSLLQIRDRGSSCFLESVS